MELYCSNQNPAHTGCDENFDFPPPFFGAYDSNNDISTEKNVIPGTTDFLTESKGNQNLILFIPFIFPLSSRVLIRGTAWKCPIENILQFSSLEKVASASLI